MDNYLSKDNYDIIHKSTIVVSAIILISLGNKYKLSIYKKIT